MQPNIEQTTQPIEQMLDKIGVQAVFGTPIVQEGVTIIPVAQIAYGFGYGGGYGRDNGRDNGAGHANGDSATSQPVTSETPVADLPSPAAPGGEGGGSGAGAGGRATPCGYIRVTPEGVTYEAITDNNRIPLAGILFAAWAVFWVMATIRTITKAVAKTRQLKNKG